MQNPLEKLRKKYGLTKEQMAVLMGLSPVSYGNYAAGRAFPRKDKIYQLAENLGLNPEELLSEINRYKEYLREKYRKEALRKIKARR